MRLCRFQLEDEALLGFYLDDAVIPIDAACEARSEETGDDLPLASGDDLLELLPPDGPAADALETLVDWIEGLGSAQRDALGIPIDGVQVLVPIPRPGKILLLAGN